MSRKDVSMSVVLTENILFVVYSYGGSHQMKTGNNKWLIVLLATLLACCLVTGTLFACQKEDDNPPPRLPIRHR